MSDTVPKGPEVLCKKVSLQFGRNIVLNNIDFNAFPGKIHCLIGPNGGGKSSLIKSILGQLHHTGTITLNWPDSGRTVGYVPQQVNLDKTLPVTVKNFLALCVQKRPAFLGVQKTAAPAVEKVLSEVKMKEKENLLFSELSGGERQRVLFAQSLVPQPGLLILDEPMNSIDKGGAQIFSEIIKRMASKGVTVIWVHHDLAEVRKVADTVTCLNREMIFSGNPQEVMDERHLLEIFAAQKSIKEN